MESNYKNKYIKYKNKYLNLKKHIGKGRELEHIRKLDIIINIENIIELLKNKDIKLPEKFIKINDNIYKFELNNDQLCLIKNEKEKEECINIQIFLNANLSLKSLDEFIKFENDFEDKFNINLETITFNILNYIKLFELKNKTINISLIDYDTYKFIMNESKKLNIHESINIKDININLYNKVAKLFPKLCEYNKAKNFIIDMIFLTIKDHDKIKYSKDINDIFEFVNDDIINFIMKSILNLGDKDIFSLVISLIVLIVEGAIKGITKPIVIFKKNNNTYEHYHNIQKINENILKIKGENQNFIQWFLINFNPLTFFVMPNSTNQDISKGVMLYEMLNLFILPNKQITKTSFMHNILFQNIDELNIKNIFDKYKEKITEEQKSCKFYNPSEYNSIEIKSNDNELDILKMFTKLKLIRFNPVKYGDCINEIKLYWEPYYLYSVYIHKYNTKFIQNMNLNPIYKNIIQNINKEIFKYNDSSDNKIYCMRNLKGDDYNIILQFNNKLNLSIYVLHINNYNGFIDYNIILDEVITRLEKN